MVVALELVTLQQLVVPEALRLTFSQLFMVTLGKTVTLTATAVQVLAA
jgi:hypothetical protein